METWNATLAAGDKSLGPVLDSGADLTITFQMFFFTMSPAIFIIFITAIYVHKAIHTKPCVQSGHLLWAKLAFAIALAGINVANLVLWSTSPTVRTDATLAATILDSAGSLCIIFLVYTDHLYSLRPSTFVSLFLSITVLLNAVETRSYFRRQGMKVFGGLSIGTILVKLILLSLEEVSKRRLAKTEAKLGKEAVSGFWNRSLFVWLNSTLFLGFRKVIKPEELQDMGPEFNSELLYGTFAPHWEKNRKTVKHALIKSLLRVVRWDYSLVTIPRLFFSGFTFAQPFLFQRIIAGTEEGGISLDAAGGLIGATAIIYFCLAVSKGYSEHLTYRVVTFVRGILVTAVFNKTLNISQDQLDNSAAVTLMSTDLNSVESLFTSFIKICVGFVDLGIGLYILSIFLGAAAFLVLVPAFVSGLVSSWVAKRIGAARRDWNKDVETRVAETSKVLSQIKSIKATGLSPLMKRRLQDLQVKEMKTSLKERHLRVSLHCMESFSSTVAPVIVIAGGLFWTRFSNKLSTSELFTSLSLITIISEPFARLLVYIPFSIGGYASLRRIEDYLLLEEHLDTRHDCQEAADNISALGKTPELTLAQCADKCSNSGGSCGVELVHATFNGRDRESPVLRDVSLKFETGKVNMIVGPVGCGKTALLKTIIGETKLDDGFVVLGLGSVGYCAQAPWLQNISIRDNIVAQSEWNSHWYQQILKACALDQDVQRLAQGDKTLALARALYSRSPVTILDDVLSSLDILTSKTVMSNIFGSNGILSTFETTVILTTNILEHLSLADAVFKFGHHGAVERTMADLRELSHDSKLAKWLKQRPEESTAENTGQEIVSQVPAVAPSSLSNDTGPGRQNADFSLYTYYLKASGPRTILLWLLVLAMTVVGDKMPAIYVRIWAEKDQGNATYFIGFAILSIIAVILTGASLGFYYFKIVPKSSTNLHSSLLKTVMRAKLWFLTTTDNGSILNRFSQDMTQISQLLPMAFMEVCYLAILAVTHVAIIAAGATYAAAIAPIVLLFIYFIQFYYLRTSRQMRHLDLEAKAPLYTHFTETASGIHHIRAYKWQAQFIWQALALLDSSQRPYYMMFCIQRWLTLVVDLTVMAVAVIVVTFALLFPSTTSAAAIGLALLNIVTFSDSMAVLVSSWARLETSLGAVARTKWFHSETPVEHDATESSGENMSEGWPLYGRIDFMDVTAKYNDSDTNAQPVLKNISATIEAGEKTGIVGRTGSGKSSMLLAILNFLDYTGTISIDGRDLRIIPQDYLRNHITTITQDGIELSGSVRINVDPFNDPELTDRLSDEKLEETLATVGLWDRIKSRGGLDASFSSMGLSHGEKQLLCLTRAILHKQYQSTRVVLADEVSSKVDDETATKIREIMANVFSTCTVITVAHRLETVEDSDLILGLEGGNLLRTRRKEADV